MEHGGRFPRWFKPEAVVFPQINSSEKDELIEDLNFDQYLTHQGSISSSGLKLLLQSPQHYLAYLSGHFKDEEDDEKDYFRFGRAAHMLILEPVKFKETYMVEPEFWGPTKDGKMSQQSSAAKAKRDAWRKQIRPDAQLLSQSEFKDLMYMLDSLVDHAQIRNMLKNGKPEVSGFFTHKETGIRVRIRPDYITVDSDNRWYVSDIKTTRDCRQGPFMKDVDYLNYDLQIALYYDGIWQITGKEPEAADFMAIEKKIPYPCQLHWCPDVLIETGRKKYEYALRILKKCLTENDWPAIQQSGEVLEPNQWYGTNPLPVFSFLSDDKNLNQTTGV